MIYAIISLKNIKELQLFSYQNRLLIIIAIFMIVLLALKAYVAFLFVLLFQGFVAIVLQNKKYKWLKYKIEDLLL